MKEQKTLRGLSNMKKRKYGFGVKRVTGDRYNHARVMFCKKYSTGEVEWVGYIEFQQNRGKDMYYGGDYKLWRGDSDDLKGMHYILKDLEKAGVYVDSLKLESLLEYLKENYHRFIYDRRVKSIVRIDNVKPLNKRRYMAWTQNNRCIFAVLAENKETAREQLIEKVEKELEIPALGERYRKRYGKWLDNKEVKLDRPRTEKQRPDTRSVEEILKIERGE